MVTAPTATTVPAKLPTIHEATRALDGSGVVFWGEETTVKYFTPELFLAGQSAHDQVLNQVEEAWEATVDRYAARLQRIRPGLPPGIVYLLDHFYLHDADVLSLGQNRDLFLFVLQLDPAYATVVLTYHLTEEAHLNRTALPAERCSPHAEWLYDELDVVGTEPTTVVHNILLSNGWEVELHFRDLQVTAVQPMLLSDSAQRRLESALKVVGPPTIPPLRADARA
jgi:hypothetical protein